MNTISEMVDASTVTIVPVAITYRGVERVRHYVPRFDMGTFTEPLMALVVEKVTARSGYRHWIDQEAATRAALCSAIDTMAFVDAFQVDIPGFESYVDTRGIVAYCTGQEECFDVAAAAARAELKQILGEL